MVGFFFNFQKNILGINSSKALSSLSADQRTALGLPTMSAFWQFQNLFVIKILDQTDRYNPTSWSDNSRAQGMRGGFRGGRGGDLSSRGR